MRAVADEIAYGWDKHVGDGADDAGYGGSFRLIVEVEEDGDGQ